MFRKNKRLSVAACVMLGIAALGPDRKSAEEFCEYDHSKDCKLK